MSGPDRKDRSLPILGQDPPPLVLDRSQLLFALADLSPLSQALRCRGPLLALAQRVLQSKQQGQTLVCRRIIRQSRQDCPVDASSSLRSAGLLQCLGTLSGRATGKRIEELIDRIRILSGAVNPHQRIKGLARDGPEPEGLLIVLKRTGLIFLMLEQVAGEQAVHRTNGGV